MSVGLSVWSHSSMACERVFEDIKLTGTNLGESSFKFGDSEYGPVITGLKFKVGKAVASQIVFSAKSKRWCFLKTNGGLDCNILYVNQTGILGSSNKIEVLDSNNRSLGEMIHTTNGGELRLGGGDKLSVFVNPSVIQLSGNRVRSAIEVSAVEAKTNRMMGVATHTHEGRMNDDGKIDRGALPKADAIYKPQRELTLVRRRYSGPSKCGAGFDTVFTPKGIGHEHSSSKSVN